MATGGKAYGSRSSYGRVSASIAHARGSGTSDTNKGNLLLTLVAKSALEACVTGSILTGRPLEGRTILSGWSGIVWIACPLSHSASLECIRF